MLIQTFDAVGGMEMVATKLIIDSAHLAVCHTSVMSELRNIRGSISEHPGYKLSIHPGT